MLGLDFLALALQVVYKRAFDAKRRRRTQNSPQLVTKDADAPKTRHNSSQKTQTHPKLATTRHKRRRRKK